MCHPDSTPHHSSSITWLDQQFFFYFVHVGHIIFFPVPCAGLFSVKIQKKCLAIKNFSVNETMSGQPNKHLIDISRIKWLVFLLRSSFFRTTSTVASSEAPADYRPAPGQTDSIPERHHRHLYKFVAGTSTEQVVDKGIRQKSTKEWTHSLTAVPFVRGHRSVFPRTPRNTCVYTRHPTNVTATCGVLTRLPAKLSKNGMHVKTSADRQLKINCRF